MPKLDRTRETHTLKSGNQETGEILRHRGGDLGDFLQVCQKEMLDKLEHPISLEDAAIPAE